MKHTLLLAYGVSRTGCKTSGIIAKPVSFSAVAYVWLCFLPQMYQVYQVLKYCPVVIQSLMHPNFQNWPNAAITIEFWMWSLDTCRWGSPISYAAGGYESADNTFLLFNYNDW